MTAVLSSGRRVRCGGFMLGGFDRDRFQSFTREKINFKPAKTKTREGHSKVREPHLSYSLYERQDRIPRLFRFFEEGEMSHFRPDLNLSLRKRLLIQLLTWSGKRNLSSFPKRART